MAARRVVVEETIMVPVPRAALTVAAPPSTVSQRTSLAVFGLPPKHFLRLAHDGAFAVKIVGKLRVAKYADVEAYLTSGAMVRRRAKGASPAPASAGQTPNRTPTQSPRDPTILDAALRRMGYRAPTR